jgi:hypothetical protein
VQLELGVTIDAGRAEDYRSAALMIDRPFGLLASSPLAFELVGGGWRGATRLDGSEQACQRDVAIHLRVLRRLSAANPAWQIRIEIEPDGGVLRLQAGSFGDDSEEVEELLRWTAGYVHRLDGAHTRLYTSVRLPPDAHRHFLDLVVAQLPERWPAPTIDTSPDAISIGFELDGDAERTAQLVGLLRYAWLTEGSQAEVLIELEGDPPIVRRIAELRGWSQLERELRAVEQPAPPAPPTIATAPSAGATMRSRTLPVLADRALTWLDDRGRIFGMRGDGIITEFAERVELAVEGGTLYRRSDGSACLRSPRGVVELPAMPDAERRFHCATQSGAVITELRGPDARLRLVTSGGVFDGPSLHKPRALVPSESGKFAMVVSEVGGRPALVTVELPSLGWDYVAPWPELAEVTDLAMVGDGRLAAVADLDGATAVYVLGALDGALDRTVYVPCRDPAIVRSRTGMVWLTGASTGRRARYDLFQIDLAARSAAVLTAGTDSAGWGALHAVHRAAGWVLAYSGRGVFHFGPTLDPVIALDPDEDITALHGDALLAVFASGPRGARLTLGEQEVQVLDLPSPGYAPRLG